MHGLTPQLDRIRYVLLVWPKPKPEIDEQIAPPDAKLPLWQEIADGKVASFNLVYLSLMFSLVLAVVPLPAMVKLFRPDWPLLVLFYWALALPFRVSIGTAFVVGFLLDVLVGTVLGC